MPKREKLTPHAGLAREDLEKMISDARRRKEPPHLSGLRMWGGDYSGVDFTSEFESKFGPHTSEILGADFRNAKLAGCNLSRADLTSANLRGADLCNACLNGANLYTALFEGANLSRADLSFSNLQSAELTEVMVDGTNFAGARFGRTAIGGVDLSCAIGLDEATHNHPSPIGADTLQLTAAGLGALPEYSRQSVMRFLRNSGLDDGMLALFRSWIGSPLEFYSVFLSHSSLDKEFARKLYSDLRALGVNCWFDEKQILPGDNILESVDKGIRIGEKFILVCSHNSLSPKTGWWVEQELERAFAKERELRRLGGESDSVLIPIAIDGFAFNGWSSRFPASVLEKHVGDFKGWREPRLYSEALDKLRDAINLSRARGR